jgi:predicted transcriptional regulator
MASGRERKGAVLTPLELEIMQALWAGGPGTVADVRARLEGDLAYTTVQTMLTVLLRKKKVSRDLVGRGHVYRPAVSREGAAAGALCDLVGRMFGGSGGELLMSLVDARQITAADLERAARLLAKAEEGEEEGKGDQE